MKKKQYLQLCGIDIPDNQGRHQFCPRESNNCCTYWQNGGSGNCKSNVNLPKVVKDLLVQIFLDLRDDILSSRSLEQTTQNPKEAFKEITWKKWPKNIFVKVCIRNRFSFSY